jgi:hypothetical protein
MELFINGVSQNIEGPSHDLSTPQTDIDMSSVHRVELSGSDPTYIVSTYALRNADDLSDSVNKSDFVNLEDHLGISNTSVHMTDRLWTALCSTNYEAGEAVEFCVVGRCVEQILCVTSIPILTRIVTPAVAGRAGQNMSAATDEQLPSQSLAEQVDEVSETALVCNIITPQYVDVQSAL